MEFHTKISDNSSANSRPMLRQSGAKQQFVSSLHPRPPPLRARSSTPGAARMRLAPAGVWAPPGAALGRRGHGAPHGAAPPPPSSSAAARERVGLIRRAIRAARCGTSCASRPRRRRRCPNHRSPHHQPWDHPSLGHRIMDHRIPKETLPAPMR